MTNNAKTLYDELVKAGIETDHHESDLYAPDTPEVRRLAKESGADFTVFLNNVDGRLWLEFPFLYLPWWQSRQKG